MDNFKELIEVADTVLFQTEWGKKLFFKDIVQCLKDEIEEMSESLDAQGVEEEGKNNVVCDEMGDIIYVFALLCAYLKYCQINLNIEEIIKEAIRKQKKRHWWVFLDDIAKPYETCVLSFKKPRTLEEETEAIENIKLWEFSDRPMPMCRCISNKKTLISKPMYNLYKISDNNNKEEKILIGSYDTFQEAEKIQNAIETGNLWHISYKIERNDDIRKVCVDSLK